MQDIDLSIQTSKAFKAIIRFMQARGLKEGDHLPPQQELRRILGFSNDTLTGAMNRLVSEGVVTRRRRVGTIVVKPSGPDQIAWSVGVATRGVTLGDNNAFRAEVAHRLVSYLLQAGCSCRLFHMISMVDGTPMPPVIERFHGLSADLTAGRLDAVIFNAIVEPSIIDDLGHQGIEAIKVSRMGEGFKGVVVDEGRALLDGVAHLVGRGARKILVTGNEPLERWHSTARQAMAQVPTLHVGKLEKAEYLVTDAGVEHGRALKAAIMSKPAAQRPDGILIGDDFTAMGFTEAILSETNYQPAIVAMTTRQVPLYFPLPVTRLELDVDQLASNGVRLLLQRLRNPALPSALEWVRRQLIPIAAPEQVQSRSPAATAK